jgi:hypothetical protein
VLAQAEESALVSAQAEVLALVLVLVSAPEVEWALVLALAQELALDHRMDR